MSEQIKIIEQAASQLRWIRNACEIDRDAAHELSSIETDLLNAAFTLETELAAACAEIETMKDALNFYGVEILPDGTSKFTPSVMDKWRKAQHDKEMEAARAEIEKANELFTSDTTTALLANILRHFDSEQISRLGRALLVRCGDIPAELEHQPLAARAEIELIHKVLDEVAAAYPAAVFTATGETLDGRAGTFARHLVETIKKRIDEEIGE